MKTSIVEKQTSHPLTFPRLYQVAQILKRREFMCWREGTAPGTEMLEFIALPFPFYWVPEAFFSRASGSFVSSAEGRRHERRSFSRGPLLKTLPKAETAHGKPLAPRVSSHSMAKKWMCDMRTPPWCSKLLSRTRNLTCTPVSYTHLTLPTSDLV